MQRLDTKLNIQFDWWKLLHLPHLNTLIDQAFNAHPYHALGEAWWNSAISFEIADELTSKRQLK